MRRPLASPANSRRPASKSPHRQITRSNRRLGEGLEFAFGPGDARDGVGDVGLNGLDRGALSGVGQCDAGSDGPVGADQGCVEAEVRVLDGGVGASFTEGEERVLGEVCVAVAVLSPELVVVDRELPGRAGERNRGPVKATVSPTMATTQSASSADRTASCSIAASGAAGWNSVGRGCPSGRVSPAGSGNSVPMSAARECVMVQFSGANLRKPSRTVVVRSRGDRRASS